jgi:hypothetical protein
MSNAGAAQVARRVSPALCENAARDACMRDKWQYWRPSRRECGRLEEGKGLCFRAEVEKINVQLANLSIRVHGNWSH